MIIYFAGPLFSLAERDFNQRLAESITNCLSDSTIILPQKKAKEITGNNGTIQDLFELSVRSIEKADVVIAILDGADVDSGTSFEVGFAYAKGKPIIGIRTDFRESEDQGVNLMISRSITRLIRFNSSETVIDGMIATICNTVKTMPFFDNDI